MDRIVVNTTHWVANASSPLYLAARIAVVLPAGMAAKTTDTPAATDST